MLLYPYDPKRRQQLKVSVILFVVFISVAYFWWPTSDKQRDNPSKRQAFLDSINSAKKELHPHAHAVVGPSVHESNLETLNQSFSPMIKEFYPLKLHDADNIGFEDLWVSETADVIDAFNSHKPVNAKTDFETVQEYKERSNASFSDIAGPKIYYLLRGEEPWLSDVNRHLKYDAEKTCLNIQHYGFEIVLKETEETGASKVGSNAFGVITPYQELQVVTYKIFLLNHKRDLAFSVPMPAASAEIIFPNLVMLYLVTVQDPPYVLEGKLTEAATLRNHTERNTETHELNVTLAHALVVNWRTKQILVDYNYTSGKAKIAKDVKLAE